MTRFAFAAALLAAFITTLAQAQTTDLRASIPFEFRVGQTEMPAGEYEIHHLPQGALILREDSGRHTALVALTVGEYRSAMSPTGALQFNRYGQTYFLAKIWSPASHDGVALPKSAREAEITRDFRFTQQTSIALVRK